MKTERSKVQPRIRILRGREIAFGPGKADLLEQVAETGSIAEGASRLGMSYMRAWTLIKTMERSFKEPLLKVSRGGASHGGAKLTPNGREILALYREMEKESLVATAHSQKDLLGRLRP